MSLSTPAPRPPRPCTELGLDAADPTRSLSDAEQTIVDALARALRVSTERAEDGTTFVDLAREVARRLQIYGCRLYMWDIVAGDATTPRRVLVNGEPVETCFAARVGPEGVGLVAFRDAGGETVFRSGDVTTEPPLEVEAQRRSQWGGP